MPSRAISGALTLLDHDPEALKVLKKRQADPLSCLMTAYSRMGSKYVVMGKVTESGEQRPIFYLDGKTYKIKSK